MKITKFKNGKIKLELEPSDFDDQGNVREEVYHNDMFMYDLFIEQINGYQYIVDANTQRVYELGSYLALLVYLLQNPLEYLLDELKEHGKMYLYPLSKRESKSLLQDLENGY